MPKNWNTQSPATRKTVNATTQAIDATNATRARPAPESRSVSATNAGTTASGFTIVINAMKDSRMTLDNGIAGIVCGAGSLKVAESQSRKGGRDILLRDFATSYGSTSTTSSLSR